MDVNITELINAYRNTLCFIMDTPDKACPPMVVGKSLLEYVKNSSHMVVFTGAGISTESGIPDFRSNTGIYNSGEFEGYSPEEILSKKFYRKNPKMFFSFYKQRLNSLLDKSPNRSHYVLTKLEEMGKLKWIVTQNIDNLHQKSGSKNVLDLHGNGSMSHCDLCLDKYTYNQFTEMLEKSSVPRCNCGGIIRPSTVLFDECLDDATYDKAYNEIETADLLIVIGSSLYVQPAAGLIDHRNKNCTLVIINNSSTPYDSKAQLIIRDNCGEILEQLIKNYE